MEAIKLKLPAEKLLEMTNEKVSKFEINLKNDVIGVTSDGCSVMIKFGKLTEIEHQLCLAHCIHLTVTDVFYKKKAKNDDTTDDEYEVVEENDDLETGNAIFAQDLEPEKGDDFVMVVEIKVVLDKIRSAIVIINRSPIKSGLLQEAVKDWQKRSSLAVKELKLKKDCKTRWNSIPDMIDSILRIETPFRDVCEELTNINFSDDEFQFLKDIKKILGPLKDLVNTITRDESTIVTADVAFEHVLKHLGKQRTDLSNDVSESLRKRYDDRKNHALVGVMKYLQNPMILKEKNKDVLFKMPPRNEIEQKIKALSNRLFKKTFEEDDTTNDDSVESDDNDAEIDFASSIQKAVEKATIVKPNCYDQDKKLSKELAFFKLLEFGLNCLNVFTQPFCLFRLRLLQVNEHFPFLVLW